MEYENCRGRTLAIRDLSAGAANYAADSIEDSISRDFLYAMFCTIQNNAIEILKMLDELEATDRERRSA